MILKLQVKCETVNTNEIWIVIPLFNRETYIHELLTTLESQSFQNYKVLIIDHGTKDIQFSNARVVRIKRSSDLWFTGALNEGLKWLKENAKNFEYFLTMNDDVKIFDPNFLQTLINAQKKLGGVVCAMGVDLENKIQYSKITLNRWKFRFEAGDIHESLTEISKEAAKCEFLPTRATLFPAEILTKVGIMDEIHFPHYGSDYEYTHRVRMAGYPLWICRETYVATESNDDMKSYVSGRKLYKSSPLRNFVKEFSNLRMSQSLPLLKNLSRSMFSRTYSVLFLSANIFRIVVGFFYTNYIRTGLRLNSK